MELELVPEPPEEVAAAVLEAVVEALAPAGDPGPWWRDGLRESLSGGPA